MCLFLELNYSTTEGHTRMRTTVFFSKIPLIPLHHLWIWSLWSFSATWKRLDFFLSSDGFRVRTRGLGTSCPIEIWNSNGTDCVGGDWVFEVRLCESDIEWQTLHIRWILLINSRKIVFPNKGSKYLKWCQSKNHIWCSGVGEIPVISMYLVGNSKKL